LQPSTFGQPVHDVLIRELNKKYANRVLHDVGLCVTVFDLTKCSEGKVRYGDGCLWHKVEFRLVVFKPFVSEVLIGKVESSTEEGIRVSMTFFDDIWIPADLLPLPSTFDPNEQAFFWAPQMPEESTRLELLDGDKEDRFYIDPGNMVRFRVESDEFIDEEPGPPKALEGVRLELVKEAKRPPYSIIGSIANQGLGVLKWWENNEEKQAMETTD